MRVFFLPRLQVKGLVLIPWEPGFPVFAALDTTAHAAFIEESRMKLLNANKLYRESGRLGFRDPKAVTELALFHQEPSFRR
jgi:hypothetical protein